MASNVLLSSERERNEIVYKNTQKVNNNTLLSSVRIPQEGEVIQMEDIKLLSVYESNELIYAAPKVAPDIIKFFDLAVSGLHKNQDSERYVCLSEKAVFLCLGILEEKDRFRTLSKVLKESIKNLLFDFSVSDEEGEIIVAFESIKWSEKSGKIEVIFTESIIKYLKKFDGKYTRYALADISKLNNKYSVFLYKIFIMHFNRYKKYGSEKLRKPLFYLEELRGLLDIKEDEYSRIDNFNKRVINDPLEDINQNTRLKITAEKEKSGRNVIGYKFFIEENPININKEEKLKPRISKAEREQKRKELAGAALASKYTKLLNKELFIGPNELMDIYLMARLQEDLYPIYDKIVEKHDLKTLERHIKYVHTHMTGSISDIKDVVAYLVRCANDVLNGGTI